MPGRFRGALHRTALCAPSLVTSLMSVAAVVFHEGWPFNHEKLAFAFRTHVYASHLAQGDFLPIWSSEDTWGLGSPFPLYYHKLFYFASSLLYLATGSMKAAIVVAIVLFLLVGCAGLFAAAARLGLRPRDASLLAATLPLQTYTIFDWLVRGAMAELSAAMIAPWLFRALLVLVQDGKVSIGLPVSLALFALAHSALACFGGIAVLVAWGIVAFGGDRRAFLPVTGRLVIAGLVVLAMLAPYLFVAWKLRRLYDVSVLATGSFHPSEQFRSLATYLSPLPWVWGREWRGVQLQTSPVTVLFFVAAAVVVARSGRSGQRGVLLLAIVGAVFAFLQTPASAAAYAAVSALALIQFPWRLLALLQVVLLLVVASGLARWKGRGRDALPWAFLLLSIAVTKSLHPIRYGRFDPALREARAAPGHFGVLTGIGEYFPRIESPDAEADDPRYPSRKHARVLLELAARGPEIVAGDGAISRGPRSVFEQMEFEYVVECEGATVVAFPHLHAGSLDRVTVSTDAGPWSAARSSRTAEDPRIRIELPAGRHTVRVRTPTLAAVLDSD